MSSQNGSSPSAASSDTTPSAAPQTSASESMSKPDGWLAPILTPEEERAGEWTGNEFGPAGTDRLPALKRITEQVRLPGQTAREVASALGRSPDEPGTARLAADLNGRWRLGCWIAADADAMFTVLSPDRRRWLTLDSRWRDYFGEWSHVGNFSSADRALESLAKARDPGLAIAPTPPRRITAADLAPHVPGMAEWAEEERLITRDKDIARCAEPAD